MSDTTTFRKRPDWLCPILAKSAAASAAWDALASFANGGWHCWPSYSGMAAKVGVSEAKIKRGITILESAGAISVNRSTGQRSDYTLNFDGPRVNQPRSNLTLPEVNPDPTVGQNQPGSELTYGEVSFDTPPGQICTEPRSDLTYERELEREPRTRGGGEEKENGTPTPLLENLEQKLKTLSPGEVNFPRNGNRASCESLLLQAEFRAGELDSVAVWAHASANAHWQRAVRDPSLFCQLAAEFRSKWLAEAAAKRLAAGSATTVQQKPEPKESDYLEALRLGVQENSALDKIGVPRQHFSRVLESWRKSADFRASERKAAAEGERVREKLRADNAERRKALDAPRVSAADRVSPPSEHERKRTPLTPEQQAARLNELAAQKPQSTGSASAAR